MLLSYLTTQLLENSPETIDYVFVYWLLSLWEKEKNKVRKNVKSILEEGQEKNFDLELDFTSKNLKDIGAETKPIEISFDKHKSKKIDELVDKQFKKLDTQVKGQILNALNTGDYNQLENTLNTFMKKKDLSRSIVSNLMRIYRTENTIMKSKVKLDIQEELAKQGVIVKRKWLHTLNNSNNTITLEYRPREDHLYMNGVSENNNGYFMLPNGAMGKAPGMFGLPEEDINCRCDVYFDWH